MRQKNYVYSVLTSIVSQIVTIVCGIILPAALIKSYGSVIYGATTSITQFLGYMALLEGGIGGVARAALYKPLADKDNVEISKIISYIQYFFRIIAFIFVIYTLVLACFYNRIARGNDFDWLFSFILVIVIALSSIAQYYFGVTYNVLLQADQKTYVTTTLNLLTTAFNTAVACALAFSNVNIIILKLAWCGGHVLRLTFLNIYIKRNYKLTHYSHNKDLLPQKWDGLGQHIAYFLHINTDIVILTLFVNLKEVSVYSIYNYISTALTSIVSICISNIESMFGELLAKKEINKLNSLFDNMEFILNVVVSICFSTGLIMVMPFIEVYTKGITDADYYRPIFAAVVLITQYIYCFRQPYHTLAIAAGHFKSTAWAAYMEAAINIVFSISLCFKFGMLGVAIATFMAVVFRTIYYVVYISNNIVNRNIFKALKRFFVTGMTMVICVTIGNMLLSGNGIEKSYGTWIIAAIICGCISVIITFVINYLFYPTELKILVAKTIGLIKKKNNC